MNNTFRINTFEAMKYSRLSAEQLTELEKEFVDFLVVNGIVAEDWIALKENEPLNADKIIDQFSDVVWEGTLRKLKYLNKIETNVAYYFKCDAEEIHLIRVLGTGDNAELHTASKKYIKVREEELFDMLQSGCEISKGREYESLRQ